MLKLQEDLQDQIIKKILDNRKNQITASDLRQVLSELLENALEPTSHLKVANVDEFLELLDLHYTILIGRLQKTVPFAKAFTTKQFEIVITDDEDLEPTLVTPRGFTVNIALNGHAPEGRIAYLKNDLETGQWKVIMGVSDVSFCRSPLGFELDGDEVISCNEETVDFWTFSNTEDVDNNTLT